MRFYAANTTEVLDTLMQFEYLATDVYDPVLPYVMCDAETKTFETVMHTGISYAMSNLEIAELLFIISLTPMTEDELDKYVDDLWAERGNLT